MAVPLDTFTKDGHVVISFPEGAVPTQQREDFIAFLKTEWIARQSLLTPEQAETMAHSIDAGWWGRNRENILRQIAEA